MLCKYRYPKGVATETSTNTSLAVKVGRTLATLDDVELTPPASSRQNFDAPTMQTLRSEFWETFQQEQRRYAMRSLVDGKFDGDTLQASIAIENITKKRVTHRTIQAWLMKPCSRSSRSCPEWVLLALKAFVNVP